MPKPALRFHSILLPTELDQWARRVKDVPPVIRLTTSSGRLRDVPVTEKDLIRLIGDAQCILFRMHQERAVAEGLNHTKVAAWLRSQADNEHMIDQNYLPTGQAMNNLAKRLEELSR